MNKKIKSIHVCSECGAESPRWQGQCQNCLAWNSLTEITKIKELSNSRFAPLAPTIGMQPLDKISFNPLVRKTTGVSELDRALGGGIVPGAVVLIGGDPGIGKSTLLLQTLCLMSEKSSTLYVSGEESGEQIALRAQRLSLQNHSLQILTEINLEKILHILQENKPQIVVIDSIQTLWSQELASAPGSVAQVRECAAQLTRLAKQTGITLILVGHVTKEGSLAGPRVLEHIVDTVLYFEGETHSSYRLLRACKNRFGAVNELGVFAMTDRGLRSVSNPSALFLSQHEKDVAGSCIHVTQEGSRPLLVEIQALVDQAHGNPRRLTVGLDGQRLSMLLAVLHRHSGIVSFDQDVFLNAVGGVKIDEPAVDLAVLLAIVSSLTNRPLPHKLIVFGEVGLAGEIRPAARGQERLREAAKLGFTSALIPTSNEPKQTIGNMKIFGVQRIHEAIQFLRTGFPE